MIQEQHAQRCQLFAQWQQFDWPIVHDPINRLPLRAVPVLVAIDEYGIVRAINPERDTFVQEFLAQSFPSPGEPPRVTIALTSRIEQLRITARNKPSYDACKELGDALVLWGRASRIDEAVQAYQQARREQPDAAEIHFRLGVAQRMRYEARSLDPAAETNTFDGTAVAQLPASGAIDHEQDFQAAVDNWSRALQLDPNHYIYRRRIEQYGPRLSKPYPFYDWVSQARAEILARGEVPIALPIEPRGAELAGPASEIPPADLDPAPPDPQGRIQRDESPCDPRQRDTRPKPRSTRSGGARLSAIRTLGDGLLEQRVRSADGLGGCTSGMDRRTPPAAVAVAPDA